MDFRSLALSLNPAYLLMFLKGRYANVAPTSIVVDTTNGGHLQKCPQGYGFEASGIAGLIIPDTGVADPTRATTLSLFAAIYGMCPYDSYRIIDKRLVATDYDLSWRATGQLYLVSSGSGTSSLAGLGSDIYTTVGVTVVAGTRPRVFLDGRFVGEMAANFTPDTSGQPTYIGSLGSGSKLNRPMMSAAMWPSALTDRNHSDLHDSFMRLHVRTSEPQITSARPLVVQNPLVHLNGRTGQGLAYDESDNAIHFDKTTGVEMEPDTPSGKPGYTAHGADRSEAYLEVTDSQLDDVLPITWAFWVRRLGNGESNLGRVYDKDNLGLVIYITNAGHIYVFDNFSVANGSYIETGAAILNEWVHFVIRYAGTEGIPPDIAINGGTFAPMTINAASSGVRTSDAGVCRILDRPSGGSELDGIVDDLVLLSEFASQETAKSIYLRSALRIIDRGYQHTYPEVPNAVSLGNVGPWSIESGSWQWDSENKLVCTALGLVSRRTKWLYGAQYFRFNKKHDHSQINVVLTADHPLPYNNAAQNCMLLQISASETIGLYRIAGGATANVIGTSGAGYFGIDVDYDLMVVHIPNGTWSVYIRGGAFSTWTLVITGTDSMYGPGIWSSVANAAWVGCEFSKLHTFPFFYGHPNDIPWLAD